MMMKKITSIKLISASILTVLSLQSNAQLPNFNFAKQLAGGDSKNVSEINYDANSNIYVCGVYTGSFDLDPSPATAIFSATAGTNSSGFFAKYTSTGNYLWGNSLGNSGNATVLISGILTNSLGDVFIAGSFNQTIDFDPSPSTTTLTPNGGVSSDVFFAKYSSTGAFQWVKSFGGTQNDYSYKISTDNTGNLYVSGRFLSTVDFDPSAATYTISSNGNTDAFIAKYTSAGNFVYVNTFGQTGYDEVSYHQTDLTGNVYLTGSFGGIVDFDPSPATYTLSAGGGNSIYTAKYSPTGAFLWANKITSSTNSSDVIRMALDNSGNFVICGGLGDATDFDPSPSNYTLAPIGYGDAYVAKYNSSGNFLWANKVATTNSGAYSYGQDVAIHPTNGDVYLTGSFNGPQDFDPSPATFTLTTGLNFDDMFVSKYNTSGALQYAFNSNSQGVMVGISIKVNASNDMLLTGLYDQVSDFDPSPATYSLALPSQGYGDIFFAKYSTCTAPFAPTNTTPNANQIICSGQSATLSASSTGTISWYSAVTSTVTLNTGNAFTTPTLSVGNYTYYAEATTCANSATRTAITLTVSTCTSIDTKVGNENLAITVFPNPSTGAFTIDVPASNSLITNITIMDVVGKIVYSQQVKESKYLLNLNHLANGLYTLKVESTEGVKTVKLIKE
jgi:hypothetical protein